MLYKIVNTTKDTTVASSARLASSFFSRLLGLMFKKKIKNEAALIFYQSPSIHTFFMRFPLDIIFLDKKMKVKKLVYGLKPWRLVSCWGAYITIELPSSKINQAKVENGDKIEIRP